MTTKKKTILAPGICAVAVIAGVLAYLLRPNFAASAGPKEQLEIYYFYDNPCQSCDDEGIFTSFFNQETGDIKDYHRYSLHIVNTFSIGDELLQKQLERIGLSKEDYSDSLLIAGDSYLAGADIQQEGKLRQLFWRESGLGQTPEVLEYYYRDDCKDCQAIKESMEAFFAAHPEIPVVRLDTNDLETKADFKALMADEDIPSERIQIPYVIYKGVHYSGNAEIEAALASVLAQ